MADVNQFIANVKSQLGVPYVFGGETPGVGFDCSGLMQWAADTAGFAIPRTSEEQFAALPSTSSPQAGDLVFFNVFGDNQPAPGHVGMCTNAGCTEMIDAPYTGTVVRYDSAVPTGWGTVMGYGRLSGSGPPVPSNPPSTPGGPATFPQGWAVGSHN